MPSQAEAPAKPRGLSPRIVILGAGPTGLGAAHRLNEVGHQDWVLLEASGHAGGLSASFVDDKGFTWDLGGHVQFSHYKYFDALMDDLLGAEGWLWHERESWVWLRERFVPYPFQMNLHRLPDVEMRECVMGLVKLYKARAGMDGAGGGALGNRRPANFGEWIDATLGPGIARVFMRPYNAKVWAYAPEKMNASWVGERVAVTDLERVLGNVFDNRDEVSWGPNNRFRFPKVGGTGSVWKECARRLPQEKLRLGARVVAVDTARHEVRLEGGETVKYDRLLSTIPLDLMVRMSDLAEELAPVTDRLLHSSTHVFGVGLRGAPRAEIGKKCWMYFPEDDCPFYRVTVFSNYSPNNVPDISQYWSLMAEVSESPDKAVPATPEARLEEVIQGMLNARLIERREDIVSTWQVRLEHGYPTPSLERDAILFEALPALARRDVYSRGRFGAWRYEVSNQDHSLMQGVEWANHVLFGSDEVTLWHPEVVNDMKRPALR